MTGRLPLAGASRDRAAPLRLIAPPHSSRSYGRVDRAERTLREDDYRWRRSEAANHFSPLWRRRSEKERTCGAAAHRAREVRPLHYSARRRERSPRWDPIPRRRQYARHRKGIAGGCLCMRCLACVLSCMCCFCCACGVVHVPFCMRCRVLYAGEPRGRRRCICCRRLSRQSQARKADPSAAEQAVDGSGVTGAWSPWSWPSRDLGARVCMRTGSLSRDPL